VRELDFVNRPVTLDEALLLPLEKTDTKQLIGSALVTRYETVGPGPYKDVMGKGPPLQWAGAAPVGLANSPAMLGTQAYLRTAQMFTPVSQAIMQSKGFSVILKASALGAYQEGPARIAAIEDRQRYALIFFFAQDKSDLVVRLNNELFGEGGSTPEMEVRSVFSDTSDHHIIFSSTGKQVAVFVDGVRRGAVRLTPEASVIWKLYPRDIWRLDLEASIDAIYSVLYRVLWLAPFGALVALCIGLSRWRAKKTWYWAAGATVGAVIIFEAVLAAVDPPGFRWLEPFISLLVCATTTVLVTFRHGLHRR
jgi:hypothetical protein